MAIQTAPGSQRLPAANGAHISSFYQERGGAFRMDLSLEEIARTLQQCPGRLWVDVDTQDSTRWLALAQTVDFHPLTIEDTLSHESRIKVEEYDNYLFVVARDATFDTITPDPYDFETSN